VEKCQVYGANDSLTIDQKLKIKALTDAEIDIDRGTGQEGIRFSLYKGEILITDVVHSVRVNTGTIAVATKEFPSLHFPEVR